MSPLGSGVGLRMQAAIRRNQAEAARRAAIPPAPRPRPSQPRRLNPRDWAIGDDEDGLVLHVRDVRFEGRMLVATASDPNGEPVRFLAWSGLESPCRVYGLPADRVLDPVRVEPSKLLQGL